MLCKWQYSGLLAAVLVNEQFEDTKGVIRNRTSKARQCNGQNKIDKRINNNIQNTAQKTTKWEKRISLWTSDNSGAPEESAVLASLVAPVVLLLLYPRWSVMNYERTGFWLRQTKRIRGHLWHRYSATINESFGDRIVYEVIIRNPWLSMISLIATTLYQGNHDSVHHCLIYFFHIELKYDIISLKTVY